MLTQSSAHRKDISTGQNADLQHRHFAFIAATIKAMPERQAEQRFVKTQCALAFADACAGTNPRFDRRRFLLACGEEV